MNQTTSNNETDSGKIEKTPIVIPSDDRELQACMSSKESNLRPFQKVKY